MTTLPGDLATVALFRLDDGAQVSREGWPNPYYTRRLAEASRAAIVAALTGEAEVAARGAA